RDAIRGLGGRRRGLGIGDVLPGEDHVIGSEWGAIGPLDVWPELPGDALLVFGDATVLERWDFGGQHGDRLAVGVQRGQRLQHEAAGVLVLGALREVVVEDGRRLPVQDLQRPTLATSASGGCHGRGRSGGGRRCSGRGGRFGGGGR